MTFEEIERPPKNRRRIGDVDLDWDRNLEVALLGTLVSGKAIVVPLRRLHSSPAKGRLWLRGFRLRHRVLANDQAAAWLAQGGE